MTKRLYFSTEVDEEMEQEFVADIVKTAAKYNVNLIYDSFTDELRISGESVDLDSSSDIDLYLSELFTNFGIPSNLMGFQYLKSAVKLSILDHTYLRRKVTLRLYPKIASTFNTKATRVERAMRHAITVAWDRGNIQVLNDNFGNSISLRTGKPTNSEFIARAVEIVKAEKL